MLYIHNIKGVRHGSKLKCTSGSMGDVVNRGGIYAVVDHPAYGLCIKHKGSHCSSFLNGTTFELVDDNPMPELEPGMILRMNYYGEEDLMAYASENLLWGEGLSWADGFDPDDVKEIYSVPKRGLDTMLKSCSDKYSIWTKTPEETPQQIALRELKELQEETAKKIKELEEVM